MLIAQELIVDNIPPLSLNDTGETALEWMDEFKVTHLSVVEGTDFVGTISESDVLGMRDLAEPIKLYRDYLNRSFVMEHQHIFEVVKVVNDHLLSIVPVLDQREHYKGSITISQLMKIIADMPLANDPGGIIVIEMNQSDYSLHLVSGIVEENNARILGTFITGHPDSTKVHLTLKLNKVDIRAIVASLQRHDFDVTYFGNSDYGDDLRDRFESFMNFIKD